MSGGKLLHPVYAALDHRQWNRAVKLCAAAVGREPGSLAAAALLAHCRARAGQRHGALQSLKRLLTTTGDGSDANLFPELEWEIKYLHLSEERRRRRSAEQQQSGSSAETTPPPAAAAAKKAGKKGKKKSVAKSQQQQQQQPPPQPAEEAPADWDYVDQLETPPTLPDDWDRRTPTTDNPIWKALAEDETLLATLVTTLGPQHLQLPITKYQVYSFVLAASDSPNEILYRKAYGAGLAVIISTVGSSSSSLRYKAVASAVLSQMQKWALHCWSSTERTLLWAAQTALWLRELCDEPKRSMLARLAESLAEKAVKASQRAVNTHDLVETECVGLYLNTLEMQSKNEEILQTVDDLLDSMPDDGVAVLPRPACLDHRLRALKRLGRWKEAVETASALLELLPDDWEYWKHHWECSCRAMTMEEGDATGDFVIPPKDLTVATEEMIERVIAREGSTRPLRGPRLMRVEIAASRLESNVSEVESLTTLVDRITEYGTNFCGSASCAFSDLRTYFDRCLESCSASTKDPTIHRLLAWSSDMLSSSSAAILAAENSEDECVKKERRRELRTYIFAVKVNYAVLSTNQDVRNSDLVSWQDLVKVWKAFQKVDGEADQAQKESRPADELILLAVQRVLLVTDGQQLGQREKLIAACLLEAAMRYSPHDAYLKISAMQVYGQLNAVARCWELYNDLYIKHIQHESCTYLILPLLRSGGFYWETVEVCQEIVGLRRASLCEAIEYTGRAMESGAVGKATEFIAFNREKMSKSLTTLEAKGLILDCAPMLTQDEKQKALGSTHGIVGDESDLERVDQMVAEVHNLSGVFSLLQLESSKEDPTKRFSENRDFGILSYEILFKTEFDSPERIVNEAVRRGRHHSLLLRAALCVDATKGPKKGKITKPSPALEKRCRSLIRCSNAATKDVDATLQPAGYPAFLKAMIEMCRAIVAVGAGIDANANPVHGSMEAREEAAVGHLQSTCQFLKESSVQLDLTGELSVPNTSRLLPDCIIPVFAIFQMCAKTMDLFGWGRRKAKTKRCAGACADIAATLIDLTDSMKLNIDRLPDESIIFEADAAEILANCSEEGLYKETCDIIVKSHVSTRCRIETVLDEIRSTLRSFEVNESGQ